MKRGRIREVDHQHRNKPWARLPVPDSSALDKDKSHEQQSIKKEKGAHLKFKTKFYSNPDLETENHEAQFGKLGICQKSRKDCKSRKKRKSLAFLGDKRQAGMSEESSLFF